MTQSSDTSKKLLETLEEPQSFDAQRMVEDIETGESEAPKVDVEQGYEGSKQFASGVPQASAGLDGVEASGDPQQFIEMAKEVHHTESDSK